MAVQRSHRGGIVLLAALTLLVISPYVAQADRPPDEKAVKQKMQGWARDLGVKCNYCHVQEGRESNFKAPTPKKESAAYCDEHFVKRLSIEARPVTCVDCHDHHAVFMPHGPVAPGTPGTPGTPPGTPPASGDGGGGH